MQESFLTPPPLKEKPTRNALGTINGCYIPCLLNILGAPLFLFVGFAVGMLGWVGALALFCFSELIAYLTITSFSALVTNGKMRGGGVSQRQSFVNVTDNEGLELGAAGQVLCRGVGQILAYVLPNGAGKRCAYELDY